MIKEISQKAKNFLPFKIESIEWNDPELSFVGKGWGFTTLSCWRIINQGAYICGSYEEKAKDIIENFAGHSILSINPQFPDLQIDPVFEISNGYLLEVFSCSYYEPWTFYIPGGPLYVSLPTESEYI